MEEVKKLLDKIPGFVFCINFDEFCLGMLDKDIRKMKDHEYSYAEDKYEQFQKDFIKYYASLDENNRKKLINFINEY